MMPRGVGRHINVPDALRGDRQRHIDGLLVALAGPEIRRILERGDRRLIVQELVEDAVVGHRRVLRQVHDVEPDGHLGRRRPDVLDGVGDRHRFARKDAVGRRSDRRHDQVGERVACTVIVPAEATALSAALPPSLTLPSKSATHDHSICSGRPRRR